MRLDESQREILLRVGVFVVVFLTMAVLEVLAPRRPSTASKARRWSTNLAIVGLGIITVRLLAVIAQPLVAIGAAVLAETRGIGLLHLVGWPVWLEIALAVIVLDFAIWLQHVASHRIPLLWRLHRMHHADVDIDVTTALRFHPLEIGLSMLYKVAWVFLLGPSALAVMLFEVVLNGCAMFNHANVALPDWLDRMLRTLAVTPDMHRIHHSVIEREHHSNFGFNLSIWDRVFGTYTAEPTNGHAGMRIGLPVYQSDAPTRLGWSLWLPFSSTPPKREAHSSIDP